MDERRLAERRHDIETLSRLSEKVTKIENTVDKLHGRIFNGMAKEIRDEVSERIEKVNDKLEKKIVSVQKLVVGIIIALLVSLAGIVIESRWASSQSSDENMRNYKAILDLNAALTKHIEAKP
jgi:hypothetical protein